MNKYGLVACCFFLTSCSGAIEKLSRAGKEPPFSSIHVPGARPASERKNKDYMSTEDVPANEYYGAVGTQNAGANSLWQPGSDTFFRDRRVRRVGDIIKVKINIQDQANLQNTTQNGRTSNESVGMPFAMGFEKEIAKRVLPSAGANSSQLLNAGGTSNMQGTGQIKRQEQIVSQVAATVIKILPNGNLMIEGSQEIRVNYELREVTIKGIVRPQDISSDNEISYDHIAEARIAYGGRGNISDVQQPRLGHQIFEAISPF